MPCRTLIVEDDPLAARTLLKLVTMLGHEAERAATVDEALRKLEEFGPRCILLDVTLPDGKGAAVLKRVRALKLPVKVAVISDVPPGAAALDEVIPLEPDAVFEKPLLIERVHDWLSHAVD